MAFAKQLNSVGLDEERSTVFQELWLENGRSVIALLRKNSIATNQVRESFVSEIKPAKYKRSIPSNGSKVKTNNS